MMKAGAQLSWHAAQRLHVHTQGCEGRPPASLSPTQSATGSRYWQLKAGTAGCTLTRAAQEDAAIRGGGHAHYGDVVGGHRVEREWLQRQLIALVPGAAGPARAAHAQQHNLRGGTSKRASWGVSGHPAASAKAPS